MVSKRGVLNEGVKYNQMAPLGDTERGLLIQVVLNGGALNTGLTIYTHHALKHVLTKIKTPCWPF